MGFWEDYMETRKTPYYDTDEYLSENDITPDVSSTMGNAASVASAPFMATPAGAAVAVGSQFLSQYLAGKAAEEKAKRDREVAIAQKHGSDEQQGMDRYLSLYGRVLT